MNSYVKKPIALLEFSGVAAGLFCTTVLFLGLQTEIASAQSGYSQRNSSGKWYNNIKPVKDEEIKSRKSKYKSAKKINKEKKRDRKKSAKALPKKEDKKWYSWFWPLGDRVEVKALKDEYVPFKTEKSVVSSRASVYQPPGKSSSAFVTATKNTGLLPQRPKLLVEAGNGFLDTGKLDGGVEIPWTGAVWQPRLWAYAINRTAFQSFKNGPSGRQRETEIANRLDLFFNLQLTGTEKILLGLRPTDKNRPDAFSRYTFSGADEGFNKNIPGDLGVETFFFEGDLGSLFPNLDKEGNSWLDFGFTVGRQPLIFQEGILINDTIDAVGIIRNNIPVPGTSNFRVSALYAWNRLDRNDFDVKSSEEDLYGIFIAADTQQSTYNLDLIYVDDEDKTSAFYVGASAIQRLPFLGGVSSAFRINSSFALEDEVPGQVGTGTLITAEFSKNVKGSDDIVYLNTFLGLGNFTQAGREAIVGGPLANTGILFASPNLSTYGAEIDPFINNDVIGGAIGYQAFWRNKKSNLILELATKYDISGVSFSSVGIGAQYQHAIGRHTQLTFEGFYTYNEGREDSSGLRAEVQFVY